MSVDIALMLSRTSLQAAAVTLYARFEIVACGPGRIRSCWINYQPVARTNSLLGERSFGFDIRGRDSVAAAEGGSNPCPFLYSDFFWVGRTNRHNETRSARGRVQHQVFLSIDGWNDCGFVKNADL